MIQVYSNPLLLDFIKVCIKMPQEEREQLEAFTGQAYDIDRAAVGNWEAPGPKWVIKADDEPIIVGGFVPQRPGVFRDFMLTTPEAWEKHWFAVTRISKRIMDAMLMTEAHRLECVTPVSRSRVFPWYKVLGYNQEGIRHGYCANGADVMAFSRVKH